MEDRKKYYEDRLAFIEEKKTRSERVYNIIATVRAIVFLAATAALIIGLKDNNIVCDAIGIVMVVLFFILVKRHSLVEKNTKRNKSEYEVVKRYTERFGEEWRSFPDDGASYIEEGDTIPVDIDLLGPSSVYQLINVCHTAKGRSMLSNSLRKLDRLPLKELGRRNEAVGELVAKTDFSIKYETLGVEAESNKKFSIEDFTEFCRKNEDAKIPTIINVCRFLLPIIEITLVVLFVVGRISYGYSIAGFLLLSAMIWLTNSMCDKIIGPFRHAGYAVEDYIEMMKMISEEEFASELINEKKKLYQGGSGSISAFKKLGVLCQLFNISFNPLLHELLNGFLLWDYHMVYMTKTWKKKYASIVAESIDCLSEMEYFSSLATIGRVKETVFPEITEDIDCFLQGDELRHPLIADEKIVSNSCELNGGIIILTGSNMSGKTTFLRTIATNLALAYIGAPVCAKSLRANYMKLFTSMRVTDDVAHGISTFYAEILRIKAMAEYKEKEERYPMLCMIDEIFKGTNSADRIVGAGEAIVRLAANDCMTVVSTHDFELCNIKDSEGKEADNYHFEEYYEEDKLCFDYKLKRGRCTTTNARAILRMAGFDIKD